MSDNYSDCQCWLVEWGEPNAIVDMVIADGLAVKTYLPREKLEHLNLQIGDEFHWNLDTQTATAVEMTLEEYTEIDRISEELRRLNQEYHETLCKIVIREEMKLNEK